MKKMLLLLTVFSLSFSGTVYMMYDVSSDWEEGSSCTGTCDDDFDSGSLKVGYNHPVWTDGENMSLSVGANLALTPSVWEKSTTADFEVSTYSVYLLPMYKFSDTMGAWMTLGYSAGNADMDPSTTTSYDLNGGMSWGLGVHYKVSDEWGLGLGYGSAGYEVEAKETSGVTKYDFDINSLSMFGTYSF
ncbi:MAG: hypothetical protein CMG09_00635 [Candidatus Marinimicrobia bacterium]|nr:hypothetical protein [Candidatus Neomarinimicrobiota bacterium]|tara:strand:+ start:1639 stop:2202 length:564 start_codon:yes stop_codon:yes gene_type:complete